MTNRESALALLVRVGATLCALPLQHVVETMRMLPVDPFPGAPNFVRGVAMVRSVPTPVVEAAVLLGSAGQGGVPGARWVRLVAGAAPVILAVDEILGVRDLPRGGRVALPGLLQDAASDVVSALGRLDAELLLVLQASHGWPQDAWAAMEPTGVPVP